MIIFKSIKVRLTIWYLIAVVLLLVVFGTVSHFLLSKNLQRSLDEALRARVAEIKSSVAVKDHQISFEKQFTDLVLIYDADGALLQRLGPNVRFANVEKMVQQALFGESSFLTAATTDDQEVRLFGTPFNVDSRTRVAIVVGRSTRDIRDMLALFRTVMIYASFAVLLLAGVGGMFLAGRTLRPVDRITDIAREIGESDLSRRIDITSEDELGRLATTLNEMIGRLEEAFKKQRQFSADASHELRTPVAVIRAESSLALEKMRTAGEEYQKSLELVSQESSLHDRDHRKLLTLARGDIDCDPVNFQDVSLKELFAELSSDMEVLAQDKGLQFSLCQVDDLVIMGDRLKLRQMFLNIMDNAIRYTPPGGLVVGSIIEKEGHAVASIKDTGPGIPAEHLPFIFDRFYRVDKSRSRAEGGTGLGLAIALSIARSHAGKIEVESQVGIGTTFHIFSPALRPDG